MVGRRVLSRSIRVFVLLAAISLILPQAYAEEETASERRGILTTVGETREIPHIISLQPKAGFPSLISLTPDAQQSPVGLARAFLVLDGKLLVTNLLPDGGGKVFKGKFPTPSGQFEYQFQVIFEDGSSAISPTYSLAPSCSTEVVSGKSGDTSSYAAQTDLLSRARQHQENTTALTQLIATVEALKERLQ